jgi:hypothetical protein
MTGLDATSSSAAGPPSGLWVGVRPSRYERGRANITVLNWDLAPSVNVDVSAVGLGVGDAFQVRDAENWYAGPVVSGTYGGAPLAVPMTGLTVVQPVGTVPYAPTHTAPQLGVFVLLAGDALATTP